MKRKFTLLFTALLLGTAGASAIEQDTDGYYKIGTNDDWKAFCALINDGTELDAKAKLTADITMETSGFAAQSVGKSTTNAFKGTFDGQGYTLTYNFTTMEKTNYVAPFRYIEGATIKNVKVAGAITVTDNNVLGGLVGYIGGSSTSTIESCVSSVTLSNTAGSGDGRIGGLVAYVLGTASATINGCLVDGTINSDRSQAAGVVGYMKNGATLTLQGVLVTSTITGGVNRFVKSESGSQTLTNCFYLNSNSITDGQGTQITDTELKNGAVAYYLQNGKDGSSVLGTQYWGQGKLNTSIAETFPVLTNDANKKVYKIMVNGVSNYPYGNRGGALPNAVRYGYTAFATQSTVSQRTPLTKIPESYESATLYGITNEYVLTVSSSSLASTLVLPFDATIPANITAYTITYSSGDKVTATKIETGTIPANTPVLINATAAGDYTFYQSGYSAPDATAITWTGNTVTHEALIGVYVQNDKSGVYNPIYYVPANSYVLQNQNGDLGFYQVSADNKIRITSFHAYLTAQAASANRLTIIFDENPTSIKDVRAKSEDNDDIYDLSGRIVENPGKGIYIKNGKKFVIK